MASLSCSITARYVHAAAVLSSNGWVVVSRHGVLMTRLGCLVTAWLSCIVTARYVDAVAGLSSHGLVVLYRHGTEC